MFRKMSLRIKFLLLFLAIGIIPLAVIGVLGYQSSQENIREEIYAGIGMFGETADQRVEDFFEEREADIQVLATTRDVYQSMHILQGGEHQGETINRTGDTEDPMWQDRLEILETLMPQVEEQYDFSFIFLIDPEGTGVYGTHDALEGANFSDRDYFQGAMDGQLAWDDRFYSDVVDEDVMVVSYPIRSEGTEGEILGVLAIGFAGPMVDAMVHEGLDQLGETADAYLVDADGLLMTNTRIGEFARDGALNEVIDTEAVDILSGPISRGEMDFSTTDEYVEYRGEMVLGHLEVARMGADPVGLIVEIDQAEAFAALNALRNQMLIIGLIAALIVVGVSLFMGNSLTSLTSPP